MIIVESDIDHWSTEVWRHVHVVVHARADNLNEMEEEEEEEEAQAGYQNDGEDQRPHAPHTGWDR